MQAAMKRGIIFDLDGTLLDTRGDLLGVCNAVFARRGINPIEFSHCAQLVGWGLGEFLRRAYQLSTERPLPTEEFHPLLAEFIQEYKENPSQHTQIYPGILELLQSLKDKGIYLGIATNKAHSIAVKVVSEVFPSHLFSDIQGPQEADPQGKGSVAKKPDPQIVSAIITRSPLSPSDFYYCGDSLVDFETAKNSALPFIAVGWGYENPTNLQKAGVKNLILTAKELLSYF